jgi:hypothetical protein
MSLLFQYDLSFPFYLRVKRPRYMSVVVLIPTDHHRTTAAKDSAPKIKTANIFAGTHPNHTPDTYS